MSVAKDCERDYFRQHPDPESKPQFDWLEFGLFSGAWENALPSRMGVLRSVRQKDGSYQVRVKLTYWGEFDKYPSRPSDASDVSSWEIVVFVIREGKRFAIDDIQYSKETEETGLRLSQLLSRGCKDRTWIGNPDEQ